MAVITIRGPLGSAAPEVGKQIAVLLGADYVDRELIAEVAAKLHRQEDEVREKERFPSTLFGRIAKALGEGLAYSAGLDAAYLSFAEMPLNDTRYFESLKSVVEHLAQSQPLVIRGRGSQFILKDHPSAFHILVVASLDVRVKRVMEGLNLDEEAAKKEIERFDNSIRAFIRRYFQADLEDPTNYDLVINTGRIRFQDAASLAADAVRLKNG
jgi:cytidylate kinase